MSYDNMSHEELRVKLIWATTLVLEVSRDPGAMGGMSKRLAKQVRETVEITRQDLGGWLPGEES